MKTGDHIQLRLEDGTSINYDTAVKQGYQISFEFYTDETKGSRIEENDSKTHVGYYIVRVVKNNAEKLQYSYFRPLSRRSQSNRKFLTWRKRKGIKDRQL